jgi:3-hydroxyacyl-CoA dehydrogenase
MTSLAGTHRPSGRFTEDGSREALGRITSTTAIDDLVNRELVVEAATEEEQAKAAVFILLDEVLTNENAALASNASLESKKIPALCVLISITPTLSSYSSSRKGTPDGSQNGS